MATLRLYGDSNTCRDAELALNSYCATLQRQPQPDSVVLQRALNHNALNGYLDPQFASQNADEIFRLLVERPESLRAPLVMRGNSFVIGSDPSRIQSLMY